MAKQERDWTMDELKQKGKNEVDKEAAKGNNKENYDLVADVMT
jgi:hypothetical protein